MDTETIRCRHFRDASTPQACTKKVRRYEDLGLVTSVDATIDGNKSGVYWLTQLGVDELAELGGSVTKPLANVNPKTIQHRLGVAKTRVALDDAFLIARLSKPLWLVEGDRNLRTGGMIAGQPIAAARFGFRHGSGWLPSTGLDVPVEPSWNILGTLLPIQVPNAYNPRATIGAT